MARRQATWTDLKANLAGLDRLGLLGLIQDLYAAHKDNRTFLHARFGLGQDVLAPYKEALDAGSGGRIAEPGYLRRESQTCHLQL